MLFATVLPNILLISNLNHSVQHYVLIKVLLLFNVFFELNRKMSIFTIYVLYIGKARAIKPSLPFNKT